MVFNHWEKVPGNPTKAVNDGGGIAREFVEKTRERRGMHNINPPTAEQYYDKL
ncbi:MAG: hypothetical protein ACE5OZ_11930 [Candidatus Heimdallarchaeota archaeon]